MRVALIIIGDEVLGAEVEDRNMTPYFDGQQNKGTQPNQSKSSATKSRIVTALDRARHDGAEVIITTGGVGITHDDRYRQAAGKGFGSHLF